MSDRLFLYLTDNPATPLWWHSGRQPRSGDWSALGQWLAQHPEARARACTVLLPPTLATRLLVSIPGTQRDKALQALPFALEEWAMDDPERLRIALGDRPVAPGRWPVLLMETERAAEIEQHLAAVNLRPQAMIAVAAALPAPQAQAWRVFALPHSLHYCVLTSAHESFAFSPADGEPPARALAALAATSEPAPTAIEGALRTGDDPSESPPETPAEDQWPTLWQDTLIARTPPSLIAPQGAASARHWCRRWVQVAVAGLILVALNLLQSGLQTWQANRQIQALNQQIAADFHAALPQVTRLVNARVQLQQALDAQNSPQETDFLGLLAQFSRAFTAAQAADASLTITALRYEQGALTLDLTATQYSSLDSLQRQLKAQDGLRLETRDAGIVNGIAKMQLKLTAAA